MAGLGTVSKLLLAFVTLLVGVILLGSVATEGYSKTSLTDVQDESFTIAPSGNDNNISVEYLYTVANAPTGWKAASGGCPLTSFVLENSSGSPLTITTDYSVYLTNGTFRLKNSTEVINMVNVTAVANTTAAGYQYCGDGYMNLSWGRTMIDLIAGFFAIAILMVSLGLFYSIAKDSGIV